MVRAFPYRYFVGEPLIFTQAAINSANRQAFRALIPEGCEQRGGQGRKQIAIASMRGNRLLRHEITVFHGQPRKRGKKDAPHTASKQSFNQR
jgi:hypothetical protein